MFLFLIFMITYADRENIAIAFTAFSGPLNINLVEYGVLTTAFFITYTIFQIPGGMMSERFGPRKIMTVAVAWWSTFTIMTGASIDYIMMLLSRLFLVQVRPQVFQQRVI
ncbi:MFS transporter [Acidiplasma cupricumulans]|uniref:MFS transporter n=1 Tax=Acidiplasma cupricumulans TaxID=312540 RepID=UPI001584B2B0|nr:MFS transporter [Acidiplasma cupricumulans]